MSKELNFENATIAVLGDYCLDEYLWIDAALNEDSLETGLIAYQCTKRDIYPGAAGTIAKNLANLGVGKVYAVGYAGDDGRGFEMYRELGSLGINRDNLIIAEDRITPAYTKPWITEKGETRELNRIDIKNYTPTPKELEDAVLHKLMGLIGKIDALIIMDQMVEENCGIITDTMRAALAKIAKENPDLLMYVDSRCRINLFDGMIIKGNNYEIPPDTCQGLCKKNGKPVICTLGANGVKIYNDDKVIEIPGIPLSGQIDVTGAGDMFTSAFVAALSIKMDMQEAGKLGNKAAAMCVQQLGTSGYVTAAHLYK